MEFRLLGPVELWVRGAQQDLPSTKLKQLLAALLWDAGQMVSTRTLVRRLWDEDAPPHELASLHSNISRLRRRLEQSGDSNVRLEHIPLGYRLLVPAESIDLVQFRRGKSTAQAAVDEGRTDEAIRVLHAAESLVHGEPLSGLPGSWAHDKRVELEEQTRDVTLRRIELELTARPQRARELLAELHRIAAEHEFDESVLQLRMRTLHLAGRTAEALHVCRDFRTRLREHNGLTPRASTQQLYQELLANKSTGIGTRPIATGTTDSAALSLPSPAPASSAGPAPARAPDTLDRDPPRFIGRMRDVETITREIDQQWESDAPVVCVIDGPPAIGKSALALTIAHRLRGRCPDGALQVNFRSHDERRSPATAETALDLALRMIGAEPAPLRGDDGLDLSIALWRRANAGKRLLLVLDDVSEPEQIQPLLPTGRGCIVLVTARTRLAGFPEAIRRSLQPMPFDEAAELFFSSARINHMAEPVLCDIVRACGGFPLALSVAGNAMRTHHSWSLSDLAEELVRTRASPQLDSIIAPALYRSFATSYRKLPELEQRLLRRLSLNPGTHIHQHAARVLLDASLPETNRALYSLVEQNLLEEPARRSYQMHDMVRLFATRACEVDEDPAELDRAVDRLVRHTLSTVDVATRTYHPHRHLCLTAAEAPQNSAAGEPGPGFSDAKQAASWLASRQEWLRAVIEHWINHGHPTEAAALTHMLARFMDRNSLWKESVPLHEASLEVWHTRKDDLGQAHALTDVAAAYWRLRSVDQAFECANTALALWTRIGDASGEADALLQIGRVHHSKHQHADAIKALRRCVELRLRDTNVPSQASALHHLGDAEFAAGQHALGIERIEQALELARAAGDVLIERNCVNTLGNIRIWLCDYEQARPHYRRALELAAQVGDRRREAVFAANLGECETSLHRPEIARPLLERAYEIYRGLDDLPGQADVMVMQAHAELELGRTRSARATLDAAASLAESINEPLRMSEVHMLYGHLHARIRDHHSAVQAYRQAAAYARFADNALMQGKAEHHIGDMYELSGNTELAGKHWRTALTHYGAGFPSPETGVLHRKLANNTQRRTAC